jgi:outer membrane autotransporter protein
MKHQIRKNARVASFLRQALKPLFAVCALAPVFGFHTASAQLIWQGTARDGGDGTWDLETPNWGSATPPAGTYVPWTQGDTAAFNGGTPGTVTISFGADTGLEPAPAPNILASGLSFTVGATAATGYNITDDMSAALILSNGAAPAIISVSAGVFATISTSINSASTGDSLTIQGGGTLILAGNNAATYLGSTITVTGGTTLQASAAGIFTGNTAFPSSADYIIGNAAGTVGGTLDLNNTSQSIATLSTPGGVVNANAIVTNSNTNPNLSNTPPNPPITYSVLTIGTNSSATPSASSTTFGGTIMDTSMTIETSANASVAGGNPMPAGGLGLKILGPGPAGYTLALSGTNSYHGITTVGSSGGNPAALQGGAANSFSPNSVVDVESSGTLDLNGQAEGIAGLAGTGTGNVTTSTGAATLTIGATPTGVTPALTTATTLVSNANLIDAGVPNSLSLIKAGAYTQVLAGTNTYSGTTTVNNGTLAAGSAGGFSAKSAYTVSTPGILDLNGFNASIGSLTGTGTVENGSGTVLNSQATATAAPTATNTPTTLNTLTVGADGTSPAAFSGLITNGSGTLALTKVGLGTLTITGAANMYTGGTNLNAGTLSFAQGSLGNGPVVFTGNSTLQFNMVNGANTTDPTSFTGGLTINSNVTATFDTDGNTTPIVFTKALLTSGGSAVQKNGLGTLQLNGNNTYNGATTVNAGTLQAGGLVAGFTGFSPNSAYTVNPGGTLDINALTPTIGSLAGTGTAIVTNNGATPGTLITGMDNTPTTFSGTLQDGTSTFALTKIGTGTFNLASDNTYSGGTSLQAGVLVISSMNALGTGNVSVTGGALQAGGPNMKINVVGNYTQGAGGELDLRIGGTAAGTFDQLAITGAASTATLSGRLSVNAVNGYAPKVGDSIPIITTANATGRIGQFTQVTGNLLNNPMVKLTVDYLANKVLLDFVQGSFSTLPSAFAPTPVVAPNGVILGIEETPIAFIQLTPNEKAVAFALDHVSKNGRSAKLLNFLDSLPITSLPGAFDRIAPAEYGAIYEISRSAAKMEATTVENRLDEVHATSIPTGVAGPAGPVDDKGSKEVIPPPENRLSIFANGSGEFVSVGDSFNASGYNFDSAAATLGIDYRFNEHFVAGVLVNYTGTTADLVDGGRLNANAFRGGVYASLFGGGAYLNAFVGGADSNYDVSRQGLGSFVHGETNGADFNAMIATGYDFHVGGATFGPVGSFQYTYTGVDSFNESGSLDPLHINSGRGDSYLTNVGARATYDWHFGSMVLIPEVRATWQHEYGDTFDEISATMLFGSPAFTVTSSPIGRDSLVLNAGFTLQITPLLSAYAFYDGELARTHYEANNVLAGFRYSF